MYLIHTPSFIIQAIATKTFLFTHRFRVNYRQKCLVWEKSWKTFGTFYLEYNSITEY